MTNAQGPYPHGDGQHQQHPQGGPYQQGGQYPQGGQYQQGQQGGPYQQGQQYQQQYGQGAPQQQPQGPGSWSDVPPPGVQGVYRGPLPGQPMTDSDARLWSLLAQLSVLVIPLLGPLLVYLIFRDRNRFVRYYAAEALSGTILNIIASIVLGIIGAILALFTFGLSMFLMLVPQVLQVIFAIIAAVKANDRQWWNYPVNLRLFS